MYVLITLLIVLFATFYTFIKRRYSYWEKLKIPTLNPSFPFGDLKSVPPPIQFENIYKEFKKKGVKHGGIFLFTSPQYFPIDPEIIRNIFVRDFAHFTDRGLFHNIKDQPIMGNLFFLEGTKWKNLRAKLTPTFTSGKMKMMFNTMLECSYPLKDRIEELIKTGEVIDAKEILALFTTDVIGSCAFGIDCNSFKNPNSKFRDYGRKIFHETPFKAIKGIFQHVFPGFAKKLRFILIAKDIELFFNKIVTDTYLYRTENDVVRNDFMQLLIELKKDLTLSMDEVIAQAFIFFIAGFDTTATLLTFCLSELGLNKEIQNKLRNEIKIVLNRNNGELRYESLKEMRYLDQVVLETMRKYPPLTIFNRICTEDYRIPGSDVTLEKGVQVLISSLGLHRDPDFFPDPLRFDPDRFSDENKKDIIPGTFIPFGDGPRICIGSRFGLMETKICLVTLLKNFDFSVNEKTKTPLEIGLGFITTVKGGVWLDAKKV
ncbi:probable cytochrome P450 6a13 [Onthophagus taurus]|uniref:probable cytochrome P450 6a13 n=1 Tax=Onthophagus taurus TaxID=166361 RepID=UPI0039BE272A